MNKLGKNNLRILSISFFLCLVFQCTGYTAGIFSKDRIGTTSAQFLKIGVGARPVAIGGTFAGVADDINTIFWNPAGLSNLSTAEISATHTVWFEEISYSNIAYSCSGLKGKIGIAVNYLSAGTIEKYNNLAVLQVDTYSAYDMAVYLSHSRILTKDMSAGMSLKIINSSIEEESATGFAVDAGILKTLSTLKRIRLGLALQNIGTGLKFMSESDPLPMNIKLGASYGIFDGLIIAADINAPADGSISIHTGAEYKLDLGPVTMQPRAGFKTSSLSELDTMSGLSGGFGLNLKNAYLDYAWVPYWEFGSTHRITASLKFGKPLTPEEKEKRAAKKLEKIERKKKEAEERARIKAEQAAERERIKEERRMAFEAAKLEKEEARKKALEERKLAEEEALKKAQAAKAAALEKKKIEEADARMKKLPAVPESKRMRIAVTDLTGQNISAMEAATVADFLRGELINSDKFIVIERSNMEKILSEQSFQQTGCTDAECAVKMGKLLNVNSIIVGSFSKLLGIYYINVRLIDVEQGVGILAETAQCNDETQLFTAVKELARKIVIRATNR